MLQQNMDLGCNPNQMLGLIFFCHNIVNARSRLGQGQDYFLSSCCLILHSYKAVNERYGVVLMLLRCNTVIYAVP